MPGTFSKSASAARDRASAEIGDYAELTPVLIHRLLAGRTRD